MNTISVNTKSFKSNTTNVNNSSISNYESSLSNSYQNHIDFVNHFFTNIEKLNDKEKEMKFKEVTHFIERFGIPFSLIFESEGNIKKLKHLASNGFETEVKSLLRKLINTFYFEDLSEYENKTSSIQHILETAIFLSIQYEQPNAPYLQSFENLYTVLHQTKIELNTTFDKLQNVESLSREQTNTDHINQSLHTSLTKALFSFRKTVKEITTEYSYTDYFQLEFMLIELNKLLDKIIKITYINNKFNTTIQNVITLDEMRRNISINSFPNQSQQNKFTKEQYQNSHKADGYKDSNQTNQNKHQG